MARLLVVVFCLVSDIAHGGTETELAHLHSVGGIYAIPSDDVDNFLIGVKTVIRKSISMMKVMTVMTVLKAYLRRWHP
jgi:hypothetical protein